MIFRSSKKKSLSTSQKIARGIVGFLGLVFLSLCVIFPVLGLITLVSIGFTAALFALGYGLVWLSENW